MGIRITKPFGDADLFRSPSLSDRLDKSAQPSVMHFAKNFLSSYNTPPFFALLKWKQ